ncbi:SDR family NAD(P)-dependent oxidoreductase [Ornithinimicrobium faecis]|uniref:SDR family NAD(P)-dependent oxidoreductase n=1 Tax=Ornithinimicrobium faecis TaxID=2934158 RepID=A0ABY4YSB6_9MICO|nr:MULTISPECIES: SDR family NAD(P)-dependent oxidoreductase [unclassified Ornithinimicrobium]USQ79489.1 SDR family NAD(P)-dependent oxidoreductase [Ornithinimicrobium sp. HY1793]
MTAMPYLVTQRDRAPAVTERVEPDLSLPRVCVIGAGSSGLAAAKALYLAGVPFDCFEMGSVVGGNWVLDNPNDQSACYETLEINTSTRRMAYSDFPMPPDYPPYAKHHQVAAYFEAYVDHFGFRHTITFGTRVTSVERGAEARGSLDDPVDRNDWRVMTEGPEGTTTRDYAAVLVANGHHWDQRWPDPPYPGTFDREQIHSHDYRSSEQLRNRHVVVVGSGNSALDIASAGAQVAASTTLSQRRGQWVLPKFTAGIASDQITAPGWAPWLLTRARLRLGALSAGNIARLGLPQPAHSPGQSHPVQSEEIRDALRSGRVTPRPAIERLAGDRVDFVDGSSTPADLIVWATGYRVSFPFLDPQLLAAPGNNLPLWKRTIHPDLPGLYFLGLLQPIGAVMPLAEAQAQWITEILTGSYAFPAEDEVRTQMTADHERNAARFYASPRHTMEVDFDHYLWDLSRERRRGRQRATRRRHGAAVVTGAGRGLGREIAVRLAREGYAVHVTDVDGDQARATAEDINATAPAHPAVGETLDVRDQEACRALAQRLADPGLALWVNNAGVLATGPVWEHDDATRRLMLEVNTLGTMHGTIAALEVMRPAERGHIINIASLAGLVTVPGEGVYAGSKHAVLGFSTSALADLRLAGHTDIHISCLCPDGLWTPMLFDKLDDPGASMSFSGKLLRPGELADVVMQVVARPRPVTSVPRWRGLQARALDLAPGLAVRVAPLVVRASRAQQRSIARRLRRSGAAR